MSAHGLNQEAFQQRQFGQVGGGTIEDVFELIPEGGKIFRVRKDILNELSGDLFSAVSNAISDLGDSEELTIGVAVVDETKVVFMSCSTLWFGDPSRFRTSPSSIELCTTY
jgi:hypothetical protein